MFLHMVMMQLNEKAGQSFFDELKRFSTEIKKECEGVLTYHFDENKAERANGLTFALISTFVSIEAHDSYQVCDTHQQMKAYMKDYIVKMAVFDGEVGV